VGGFDFLGGQQIDVNVSKSRTDSSGFGLTLTVPGDPILLGWNQTANNGSGAYSTGPCPGKVSAYRFNAFYLAPSTKNSETFQSIVDPIWLRSDDPSAIALRSAKIADHSFWRVLYRVTYMSRVPPLYDDNPGETLSPKYNRTINLSDNSELTALIMSQLGHHPITPVNVAAAISAVIAPNENNGKYPPSVLGTLIPWWEEFLSRTRSGNSYNAEAATWLNTLLYDTLTYLLTGLANGNIVPPNPSSKISHAYLARLTRVPRARVG
jgi:large repetitive protein